MNTQDTLSHARFQRPPRLFPDIPRAEIQINPPPSMPNKPSSSRLQQLTFVLPLLLSVGSLVMIVATAGTAAIGTNLLMFLFMGTTGVISMLNWRAQLQQYRQAMIDREEIYKKTYLKELRQRLTNLHEQQRQELLKANPSPLPTPDAGQVSCTDRVSGPDRRLWERDSLDADFLACRVGLGKILFSAPIKAPPGEIILQQDPLLGDAQDLAKAYEQVPNCPLTVSLKELGSLGLTGDRRELNNITRSLIVQLTTNHSHRDALVAALFPKEEADWRWLQDLPHSRHSSKRLKNDSLIAFSEHESIRVLDFLTDVISTRRNKKADTSLKEAPPETPTYIVLVPDITICAREPAFAEIMESGKELGVIALIWAARINDLPHECRHYLELGKDSRYVTAGIPPRVMSFVPDRIGASDAEGFADAMTRVDLFEMSSAESLPSTVELLALWGSPDPARLGDLKVEERWREHIPSDGPTLAVPIGMTAGGKLISLNLHDKLDRTRDEIGHGPHGLIAGTTGSGKSELLQAFISSMAVNYSPEYVSFFLIDFKGGGMTNVFKSLPHVAGAITDLANPGLLERALLSIDSEIEYRKRLFAETMIDSVINGEKVSTPVNYIDDYQNLWLRSKKTMAPLPRLVIIIDEFAELAIERKDFLERLVSIARIGRTLGIHLVLATQRPGGVVNEQMWANTQFKICLRVNQASESQEVLRRPEASLLKASGEAYIQVGNNTIFKLFKSAYGGLRVNPSDDKSPKQIELVVQHLSSVVQRPEWKNSRPPQIWTNPLQAPRYLADSALCRTADWSPDEWKQTNDGELRAAVGLIDDIPARAQYPLVIDLSENGNYAIYGASQTGKSTLLQSLIVSLARKYPPEQLQMYLVDFDIRELGAYEGLPHVGAVVFEDEEEKFNRLVQYLEAEYARRRRNRTERRASIVVVIDRMPRYVELYSQHTATLASIMRDGPSSAIYFVMTAQLAKNDNIPGSLRDKIGASLTFEMNSRDDYYEIIGRLGEFVPVLGPGKGLIRIDSGKASRVCEFLMALPFGAVGDDRSNANKALKEGPEQLGKAMSAYWAPKPRTTPLRIMPVPVEYSAMRAYLPEAVRKAVPLGLGYDDLAPLWVDLDDGPHFFVTGETNKGKTNLLKVWLRLLAERLGPDTLELTLIDLDQTRGGLAALPQQLSGFVRGGRALGRLEDIVEQLRPLCDAVPRKTSIVVIDSSNALIAGDSTLDSSSLREVQNLLKILTTRRRGENTHVIVSAPDTRLNATFSATDWLRNVREQRAGFYLGNPDPNAYAVTELLRVKLTSAETKQILQTGEGYFRHAQSTRSLRFRAPLAKDSDA